MSNAPPQRVVPALFQALDADDNGMTDTLVVFAYLFPAPEVSPLPVYAVGEFRFTLTGPDDRPVAQWVFPSDQVLAHRDADTFGPTHSFTLDIKASAGTDQLPIQNANLWATFVRADGVEVPSAGPISVRVGD